MIAAPVPPRDRDSTVLSTSPGTSSAALWSDVSAQVRETLNERAFDTWFSGAVAQLEDDGILVLRVPNEFTRSWIESRSL